MGIPFKDAVLSRRKDEKDGEESIPFKDAGLYKRKSKEIKPYAKRYRCPFYGFTAILHFMRDSGDNQCALKIKLYDPCQMEMAGDKPIWIKCPLNTEENRRKIEGNLEKIKVFPREFRPLKKRSWPGISLGDWMIDSQQS